MLALERSVIEEVSATNFRTKADVNSFTSSSGLVKLAGEDVVHLANVMGAIQSRMTKAAKKEKTLLQMVVDKLELLNPALVLDGDAADDLLYCYCNRPDVGLRMVGCDGKECTKEWCHLGCTGLEAVPTGSWYCRDCKPRIGRSEK